MPVEIIITGDNAEHAASEIRVMAEQFGMVLGTGNAAVEPRSATTAALQEIVDATVESFEVRKTETKPKGRTKKETPAPVVQEDPPEVQAQDAADEAAEAEAAAPARVYTYEDVRAALSGYVKKYGLPAVQEDGLKIYESIQPGAKKVSDFPDDSAVLAKVVAAVEKVIAENPYNRPTVGV